MAKVRITLCSNSNRTIQSVILVPSPEWSEATWKLLKAAAQSKLRLKNAARFFDADTGAELLPGSFLRNDMLVLASSGGDYIGKASPSPASHQAQSSKALGALPGPLDSEGPQALLASLHPSSSPYPAPPTVKLIASRAEVAASAIEQLRATAKLPGMVHAIGMPDLHPGANGSPVGAAFVTADVIYPSLIGPDIGCGMRLYQLPALPKRKLMKSIAGCARRLKGLDLPVGKATAEMWLRERGVESTPFDGSALGTIGGGNHFAELQVVQEVRDEGAFAELGLSEGNAFLLVHSGSRGFGKAVLERFEEKYGEGDDYEDVEQHRTDGHGQAVLEKFEEGVFGQHRTDGLRALEDAGSEVQAEATTTWEKADASEDLGCASQEADDKAISSQAITSQGLGCEPQAAEKTTSQKVHSGRRAAGVPAASRLGKDYLLRHDHACAWAKANRELIAARLLSCLNIDLDSSSAELVFDVWHNNVEQLPSAEWDPLAREKLTPSEWDPFTHPEWDPLAGRKPTTQWVHRKGAAPADRGPVMIPGSRGTASYLVKPKTQRCSVKENGLSLAHGGGRRWTRAEAVRKLRGRVLKKGDKMVEGGGGWTYTGLREELLSNSFGGVAICDDKSLVYEEAAEAYKCIEDVVGDLEEYCNVVAVFAPIISYKVRHA